MSHSTRKATDTDRPSPAADTSSFSLSSNSSSSPSASSSPTGHYSPSASIEGVVNDTAAATNFRSKDKKRGKTPGVATDTSVDPCTCSVNKRQKGTEGAGSNKPPCSHMDDDDESQRNPERSVLNSEKSLDTCGNKLLESTFQLIHELLDDWNDVKDALQISLERVSGAMTNCVYFVTGPPKDGSPRKVVMRVYGAGVEQFIDRERELKWLRMLPNFGVGPLLLATFQNGRFEQYIASDPLKPADLSNPSTSRQIADQLALLHGIARHHPPSEETIPAVWANIDKWYSLATGSPSDAWSKEEAERVRTFDLVRLRDEIDELKNKLIGLNSPIVFAHNDVQYGNVLRCHGSNELAMVDFEYSGYNYRAFDIGSHWCEWMYDYNSETDPHRARFDRFPTPEQQRIFLRSYITTERKRLGIPPLSDSEEVEREIESRRFECNAFVLASHVMWGLWGVMQSRVVQSEIDFAYLDFGLERLEAFRRVRDQTYTEIDEEARSRTMA